MKKLLAALLTISMIMTVFVIAPITASAEDSHEIEVPSTWKLMGEESFIREPVENEDGTVTNKFGISTIESDFFKFVETTAYSDESKGITQDDYTYLNSNGLNLRMPKAKANNSITFKMAQAIDLTSNGDYYMTYDVYPVKTNVSGVTYRLYNSDKYVVDTDGAYSLDSGLSSNNSPFTLSQHVYRTYLRSDGKTGTATLNTWTDREHDYATYANRWFKVLVQISPRENGYTMFRERWFDISGAEDEQPSVNPSYWNSTTYFKLTDYVGNKLDTLYLAGNHNSGSTLTLQYKNLKLYRAAGLNAYMTPTVKADKKTVIAPNYIQPDAVVSIDGAPYTMTMDSVPEGIELVSQGWYDYSDETNPVLLKEGSSIDVPASMRGKLLKAKLVVKENGVENTYYPFSGKVRDIVDLHSNANNNVLNTNPFTAKVTYYKTNADGSLATKTTQSSNNSSTAALTYADWKNATRIEITGQFYVNSNVTANDGLAVIVFACYDKDGVLKKVIKPTPLNDTYLKTPTKIGGFTSRTVQAFSAKLIDGQNYDFSTLEGGDYFKCFLWRTSATPAAAADKKIYYNFEQMIPISYNPNRTAQNYDVNLPVATVPMPADAE